MQRLYSAFPDGRPGVALLVMRVALSVLLLDGVLVPLDALGHGWVLLAPWSISIALWLGLLTPVAAVLSVLIEASTVLSGAAPVHAVHVCAVLDAFSLSLLGPGAYSLDAKLFGRRRIVLPPRDGSGGG